MNSFLFSIFFLYRIFDLFLFYFKIKNREIFVPGFLYIWKRICVRFRIQEIC